MKRLSLIIAASALVAGCATSPPPRFQQSVPQNPERSQQNYPGYSAPLPSQQAPTVGQGDNRSNNGSTNSYGNGNSSYGSGSNSNSGDNGNQPLGEQPSQSSPQQQPSSANGSGPSASARQAPPQSAKQISSPAVMSLLQRADTLANAGHMSDAAASLERALDLAPRNPFIYQRLAAVRLAQGQPQQAEQIAMKSNSLAGNNPFVESGNWQLIAQARKSAGNTRGETEALSQAESFRQSAAQYTQ